MNSTADNVNLDAPVLTFREALQVVNGQLAVNQLNAQAQKQN